MEFGDLDDQTNVYSSKSRCSFNDDEVINC